VVRGKGFGRQWSYRLKISIRGFISYGLFIRLLDDIVSAVEVSEIRMRWEDDPGR